MMRIPIHCLYKILPSVCSTVVLFGGSVVVLAKGVSVIILDCKAFFSVVYNGFVLIELL